MDRSESSHPEANRRGRNLVVGGLTFVPRLVARTIDQARFTAAAIDAFICLTDSPAEQGTANPVAGDLAEVVEIDSMRARSKARARSAQRTHPSAPEGAEPTPLVVGTATGPSDDLPIPSYDELAASQVVPRLAALSHSEREAIRDYERSHRGRRTILGRLDQLAGGDG